MIDLANVVWEQATTMNQIRYYQLRMMETPVQSPERQVYREQIRNMVDEMQKTLTHSFDGRE